MEKTTIRVQLDTNIVKKATEVLKKYNLTSEEAITMLYEKFILTGQLPYEFKA